MRPAGLANHKLPCSLRVPPSTYVQGVTSSRASRLRGHQNFCRAGGRAVYRTGGRAGGRTGDRTGDRTSDRTGCRTNISSIASVSPLHHIGGVRVPVVAASRIPAL